MLHSPRGEMYVALYRDSAFANKTTVSKGLN